MSLDVTLAIPRPTVVEGDSPEETICREILEEPEPTYDGVFEANITHNLNKMAQAAGLYECLWYPDSVGITTAVQLVEPLRKGLEWLRENEAGAKNGERSNGRGAYRGFVPWINRYLAACEQFPHAEVKVSR